MNLTVHKQKNRLRLPVTSLLMILFLTGCSTLKIGNNFDMQAFEGIVKVGETSKSQVQTKMGSPKSKGVSLNRDGERLVEWVYFYATGKLPGMDDAQLKILQIRFDKNDILRSYNWSDSQK